MKVLITAGGTSEKIDNVRKITNSSSGMLGSIIASEFLNNFDNIEKLYYLCPKTAKKPPFSSKICEINVESVQNVYDQLHEILTNEKIDIIVHSMAISDYTVQAVSSSEILATNLENKSKEEILSILSSPSISIDNSKKISSNQKDLILRLVPTPKIISKLKKWSPNCILIGFKLLSNVEENELKSVAYKLLQNNNCDFVVANDIANISQKSHKAFIIDKDFNQITAFDKLDIAKTLCNVIKTITIKK